MTTFRSSYSKLLWPSVVAAWEKEYGMLDVNHWLKKQVAEAKQIIKQKEKKVYFIKLGNKRFNTKNFDSYENARKYVRKLLTKRFGKYQDNIGEAGFSVASKTLA